MKFLKETLRLAAVIFGLIFCILTVVIICSELISPQAAEDSVFFIMMMLGILVKVAPYFPGLFEDKATDLTANQWDLRTVVMHPSVSISGRKSQHTKRDRAFKGSRKQ